MKIRILENLYLHDELDSFPIPKGFADEISGDTNKRDIVDGKCPHLEDLHNSLSHYLPNDRRMMLQNQA